MAQISIDWVGHMVFREKDYDRLQTFFKRVWAQPHDYKVAMVRRCFNLNTAFLRSGLEAGEDVSLGERVISQNALLLYAKEIAGRYRDSGRFPRILVVDDVLLYGRGIVKVINALERLVIAYIEELSGGELAPDERYYIHRDLAEAIDIYVYGRSKNPVVIENTHLWKVEAEQELYEDDLLKLSERISTFLQKADIPNTTSYTLAARIPARYNAVLPGNASGWEHILWKYRWSEQDVYLRKLHGAETEYIQTVQLYSADRYRDGGSAWLTGMPLYHGVLPFDVLGKACRKIADGLPGTENFDRLRTILCVEKALLQKQRAQMLACLASVVCLYDFHRGCGLPWSALDFLDDIDRISNNFARKEEIKRSLVEFCSDTALIERTEAALLSALRLDTEFQPAAPERGMAGGSGLQTDASGYKAVNESAENVFCKVEMDAELEAYEYASNLRRFRPRERGKDIITLDRYLASMLEKKAKRETSVGKNVFTERNFIACMLMLSYRAVVSTNHELTEDGSGVECTLKAGELSTYTIPRRFRVFIPALALIEKNSVWAGRNPKTAVLDFIGSPELETDATADEKALIGEMRRRGGDYLDVLYQCHKSIRRWDINFSTEDDWRERNEGADEKLSYLSFVQMESERQDHYLQKAKDFLSV